jgi:hypothetical protein
MREKVYTMSTRPKIQAKNTLGFESSKIPFIKEWEVRKRTTNMEGNYN